MTSWDVIPCGPVAQYQPLGHKMEAARFPRTLVPTSKSTRHHNPEGHHRQLNHRENFKSKKNGCLSYYSRHFIVQRLCLFHENYSTIKTNSFYTRRFFTGESVIKTQTHGRDHTPRGADSAVLLKQIAVCQHLLTRSN